MRKKYRLRKAAGSFWLLDLSQSGKKEKLPLELNESAAQIWQMYEMGLEPEAIAEKLAEQYGVSTDRVRKDVAEFFSTLG